MFRTTRWKALTGVLVVASLNVAVPALAADDHDAPAKAAEGGAAEGSAEQGAADHDAGHHEINWIYGMLGEGDEGEEPNLAFRPPGMPVPVLAMVINSLILFGAFYALGKRGVKEGLRKRRQQILQGMEDAAKMRQEAKEQLASYEQKLAEIDAEVERLRREMREAAEVERVHILSEAKARRERMERDARILVEQELKAAHEDLMKATVRGAVESAERLLVEKLSRQDEERFEREYLGSLKGGLAAFLKGAA